ncbi:phage fiber-tail adaptor protein [Nocardia pseudovaccinii]|uniref:phage fiber-tail adaptor protein n=1 Tax=Nocardia pseudovaccinii TaxID=189540 RepID=UPI0012F4F307|nr:hypothetical protein [Nocardia pseudovaccinii]
MLAADGFRMPTQGMMIDSGDLERYRAYGWRLPLGAPAIPETTSIYDGFTKSPTDIYPWTFDWSEVLAPGETITASQFLVIPGLTLSSASHTDSTTTVLVAGGALGTTYLVTNRISTSAGNQQDWSFQVTVTQQ